MLHLLTAYCPTRCYPWSSLAHLQVEEAYKAKVEELEKLKQAQEADANAATALGMSSIMKNESGHPW